MFWILWKSHGEVWLFLRLGKGWADGWLPCSLVHRPTVLERSRGVDPFRRTLPRLSSPLLSLGVPGTAAWDLWSRGQP